MTNQYIKQLRIVFLITAFTSTAFILKAQTESLQKAFSIGGELGIPNFDAYAIGIGVSAKGELPVSNKVAVTATAGYSAFFYKSGIFRATNSSTPSPAGYVPLKAGAKYYATPQLFFEGELGAVFETKYDKQSLFAFSIGPGFVIPTKGNSSIELGFRYEKWSQHQLQQTAIRFAYRLGW